MDEIEPMEAFENVMVMFVQILGKDILVDVYGSDDMIMGTLTYTVDDPDKRQSLARTLHRWGTEDKPLTYVRSPEGIGRLVCENEVDRDEAGI